MKKTKKYFLLLFLFSPISGMEHHIVEYIPAELLSHIVRNCDDLYTANSLLRSCTTIHNLYRTYSGTVTEKSFKKIFFGLDRVIHDNPTICNSLSNASYLKGLMHYAQQYDKKQNNKKKVLLLILCENATPQQQEVITSIYDIFTTDIHNNSSFIDVCIGKKPITCVSPTKSLSVALDIHLQNRRTSVMTIQKLFFIAVDNNIVPAVKKIIADYTYTTYKLLSINPEDDNKRTTLQIAVAKEYPELINLLLEHKDIDLSEQDQGLSVLRWASGNGDIKMVQQLLQYPQIDIHQWVGEAFISAMKSHKATSLVKYLLEHSNPDLASYGGEALYKALNGNFYDCYENIVALCNSPKFNELNINYIDSTTKFSSSCLSSAVDAFNRPNRKVPDEYLALKNIIELLLKHENIDVNILYHCFLYYSSTPLFHTPLYLAAHGGNTGLVQLLIKHPNINPNIICTLYRKETALHAAIRGNHTEIIELLRKHPKIDLSLCDQDGISILELLSEKDKQKEEKPRKETTVQSSSEPKNKDNYIIIEAFPKTMFVYLGLACVFCGWLLYKTK